MYKIAIYVCIKNENEYRMKIKTTKKSVYTVSFKI